MFSDLNVFRMANAMAVHAGQRQAVISQNIANADTPGYRARDIPAFAELYRDGWRGGELQAEPVAAPVDMNGNSVSLELELLRGVEAKQQHDRALSIYRASLNILRTAIGRS